MKNVTINNICILKHGNLVRKCAKVETAVKFLQKNIPARYHVLFALESKPVYISGDEFLRDLVI